MPSGLGCWVRAVSQCRNSYALVRQQAHSPRASLQSRGAACKAVHTRVLQTPLQRPDTRAERATIMGGGATAFFRSQRLCTSASRSRLVDG